MHPNYQYSSYNIAPNQVQYCNYCNKGLQKTFCNPLNYFPTEAAENWSCQFSTTSKSSAPHNEVCYWSRLQNEAYFNGNKTAVVSQCKQCKYWIHCGPPTAKKYSNPRSRIRLLKKYNHNKYYNGYTSTCRKINFNLRPQRFDFDGPAYNLCRIGQTRGREVTRTWSKWGESLPEFDLGGIDYKYIQKRRRTPSTFVPASKAGYISRTKNHFKHFVQNNKILKINEITNIFIN